MALWTGIAAPSIADEEKPPALSFEASSERIEFAPDDIWAVTVQPGFHPGGLNLEIMLDGDAKARFARFTAVHVGQRMAVFVGDEFLMEPVLQAPIEGGRLALAFPDQPSAAAAMDTLLGR